MTLAHIIKECEDELICDLAETYNIYDYRGLSPYLVATLTLGLRDNSRVKMKLSGIKVTTETMLNALMVDKLQFLCWTKTKDAQHNRNRPKSILTALMTEEKQKDELMSFETIEEYENHMKKLNEVKQNA